MKTKIDVLVVGGNGGIGSALVQAFLEQGEQFFVHGTWCHNRPHFHHDRLSWHNVDIADEASIEALAGKFGKLDYLINAVGVLHNDEGQPEKSISQFNPDFFLMNARVNAMPSLLLAKHFQRALKAAGKSVFAALSAKVGSVGGNRMGGWYSYRTSKAALNQALKTLSIEWHRTLPGCCVATLHPGTADTALSKPFQSGVSKDKLFTPQHSATCLLEIITDLTPEQTGRFWAWDGSELPW